MNRIAENDYESLLPRLESVEEIVEKKLLNETEKVDIPTLEITHRVKSKASAIEKIKRKPDNYSGVDDLTDLVGFRIICFFSDDVDKIASVVERLFVNDIENSVDKRQIISPTAFGYLSLHYICSLPESSDYPKELCDIKFEIQIRSSLQHTWAEIEHDLGYKSVFAIPREIRREFSRIAGLLELADESFVRIRKKLAEYKEQITDDIRSGRADVLSLDLVTLSTYIKYNDKMKQLNEDIANIQGAEIVEQSPEGYLPKLESIGITKLSELSNMLECRKDFAYLLAKELFENADLDEIASTAGLYFICRAELICGKHTDDEIKAFFMSGTENKERAKKQAAVIIARRENNG